jgi:hypothetical protein
MQGFFLEDTESWKAQKNLNLQRSRRKARGQVPLKVLRRRSDGDVGGRVPRRETPWLVVRKFRSKRTDGLEFSEENS